MRLGAGGPKALVDLAGRPLVAWSLAALAESELIGRVVIAAPPGHEAELEALAGESAIVVAGGASRSQSVANALAAVATDLVVIHDAARPLAPAALFDEVVAALAGDPEAQGVIAAAPLADTLKRAGSDALEVSATVSRAGLWRAQTPQAFRRQALADAHGVAEDQLAAATDDAMLVEATGGTVRLCPFDGPNPKVTTRADLQLAEALLSARAPRTPNA